VPNRAVVAVVRCRRSEAALVVAERMQAEPLRLRLGRRTLHKIFLELRHHNSHKTPFDSSSVTQMYSKAGEGAIGTLADDAFAHGVQDQFRNAMQVQLLENVGAMRFDSVEAEP
jgi:hypothetical protein